VEISACEHPYHKSLINKGEMSVSRVEYPGEKGLGVSVFAEKGDEKRSLGMNNDQLKTPPKSETVEDLVANRQALAGDPYRPLYHFSPPGFGLHDPGGVCYWKGINSI
jgi:hypothetical protein